MRFITPIADRLVSAVVPRVTAGACCPPDPYTVTCTACARNYAHVWQKTVKTCSYNCACQVFCGGCNAIGCSPP